MGDRRLHRWVEHTGELELELSSSTEEGVFADALAALGELLDEGGGTRPATDRQQVSVTAPERALLLAEWLGELAFRAETEGFVPLSVAELGLTADRLEATVEGRTGRPAHLVKAVTYHELRFERDGDRWRAHLVLDV
ncbi:MAG: archease [Solirubrobacteraceae bacterium]